MSNRTPPSACLYFQVHQPYRLRDLRFTDIGKHTDHFDGELNEKIFRKVAEKCYLPTNALLLRLLSEYPDFAVSFSLSGTFLDQCEDHGPDVLASFKALADTGKVEFLAETHEHSLASLKSVAEFCRQVKCHADRIEKTFGTRPTVFRNTELIYNNELAHLARLMGFHGMLAEGADHLLGGRSANHVYRPPAFRLPRKTETAIARNRPHATRAEDIALLLKNYRLSDDVAFRFGNKNWPSYPLTADTFAAWMDESGGDTVNLFMDYETFGEHQWADTGIFDFLAALPKALADRCMRARTPSQVIADHTSVTEIYDAHAHVSWADTERDLSAWLGNGLQRSALDALFALEPVVLATKDQELIRLWRRLQTSDHFYYMCTKYWNDGDVHKYFSPYDSPYEAYRRFSHAICDLQSRLASPSEPKS